MSERKTSEIKFRCTPTFKAGVQASAEAAGQSLSSYLESAVWALQNQAVAGVVSESGAFPRVVLDPEEEKPYGSRILSDSEAARLFARPLLDVEANEKLAASMTPTDAPGVRVSFSVPTHGATGIAKLTKTEQAYDATVPLVTKQSWKIPVAASDTVPPGKAVLVDTPPSTEPCACRPWEFCRCKADA